MGLQPHTPFVPIFKPNLKFVLASGEATLFLSDLGSGITPANSGPPSFCHEVAWKFREGPWTAAVGGGGTC